MKNSTKILPFFLFFMACVFVMQAQDVAKISIQGNLKDASGAPVDDGTYTVDFKLYHASTGGTAQWVETAMVDVTGGIYSHLLGSVTPLNPAIFGQTLYMGINVNNIELQPRTELTYAPYTIAASTVSCSGALGDVKYSILNPTQFASVNGDCWIPMDGGDMSGSALSTSFPLGNTVPDMSGLFIRAQEYNEGNDPDRIISTPVATIQDDVFKTHSTSTAPEKTITDSYFTQAQQSNQDIGSEYVTVPYEGWSPAMRGYFSNSFDDAVFFRNAVKNQTVPAHNHTVAGGEETRSKNMNFYIYIRVNN